MEGIINQGIRAAWRNGLEKAGILENEMTADEIAARNDFIHNQYVYLDGLADAIAAGKRGQGKLGNFLARSDLWINAFNAAVNQAFVAAAGNKKLEWVYGDTEHCEDCLKYNGRVYRASTWDKYDIRPQSHSLACRGFRCHCAFVETDSPVTKGRPPGMKF